MQKTNIFTLLISTEVPVMTQLSRILDNIIHMYYTVPYQPAFLGLKPGTVQSPPTNQTQSGRLAFYLKMVHNFSYKKT